MNIQFTWDESKRLQNIRKHGLDFVDVAEVFQGLTVSYEDDRLDYGDRRFITLGFIEGVVVSVVHTETDREIHVISFRKGTRREGRIFYESI